MNAETQFEFSITREFDAPRELVWRAWTDPDALLRWWSPKGFKTLSTSVDLRPGGIYHYGLEAPNGHQFWGRFVYREIVAPERLVYVMSFSDENAGIGRHFLNPKWPAELLTTVTFKENGGTTELSLRSDPINATEEEIQIFKDGQSSMQAGFGGTFDQLAGFLAAAVNDQQGVQGMEKVEPAKEHQWLQRLAGEWQFETECVMGPDQPAWKSSGTQSVRSLGGLWSVGELRGEMPDGTPSTSIITLGYDPAKQKFVGTFVASMMTHLWPYEGTLDGDTLTLESEGPSFADSGATAKYHDIVELQGDDSYAMYSEVQMPDGSWNRFMTMTCSRVR